MPPTAHELAALRDKLNGWRENLSPETGWWKLDNKDDCFQFADTMRSLLPAILAALDRAIADRAEVERLRRGDFTPEEFQGLCHHRDKRPGCKPAEFFQGCEDYQRKLFGYAEADEMRKAIDLLSRESDLTAAREQATALVGALEGLLDLGDCPPDAIGGVEKLVRDKARAALATYHAGRDAGPGTRAFAPTEIEGANEEWVVKKVDAGTEGAK